MRRSSAGFVPAFTTLILGATVALTVAACGTVAPSTGAPLGTASSHTAAPPITPKPSASASASTAPVTGTWQLLPPAPRTAPLMAPVSVWTGHQVLIYGLVMANNPYGNRGVLLGYTPATGQWRRLAPAPAPRMGQNGQFAAWDGTEMLVFGLTNAAYNPAANTWRPITPYPRPNGAVSVWTGHQVIMWGGGCCGGANSDGAAYTPAANTWRELPPSPLPAGYPTGVWTGTEVIIAGGWHPTRSASGPSMLTDAAAYNPTTRTWRTLPPMPQPRSGATAVRDGTEALFIGGTLANGHRPTAGGFGFNPGTGQWRRLPPMESGRSQFAAVWTGHQVLVWGGLTGRYGSQTVPPHGVAYEPVTNRWSALPQAPLRGRSNPLAVWTGDQMIVWGGQFMGKLTTTFAHDGAAYQPPTR
jgi:galactose oxidase-like protein